MRFIKIKNNFINIKYVKKIAYDEEMGFIHIFVNDECFHLKCGNSYCFDCFCKFMKEIHKESTDYFFNFYFDFEKHIEDENIIEDNFKE